MYCYSIFCHNTATTIIYTLSLHDALPILELAQKFYDDYHSEYFFQKSEQLVQQLENKGFEIVEVDDPLKLNVRCRGYHGYELQSYFEAHHNYVELADDFQGLMGLPVWHEGDKLPFDELLTRIEKVQLVERQHDINVSVPYRTGSSMYYGGEIHNVRKIDIKYAENKILANHIVPYPPGIPIMFKGEKITEDMVKL